MPFIYPNIRAEIRQVKAMVALVLSHRNIGNPQVLRSQQNGVSGK
jgi:hypothetical protein